jgi:kynurenine formamidase
MQASEAIKALANAVDSYILGKHTGIFSASGAATTTPFASDLTVAGKARVKLNKQLAPVDDRRAVLDPDAEGQLLTVADIEAFEIAHGRIPPGAWVLMRTDWSRRRDPEAYQNFDETGQHTPGPSTEAVRFLVEQRDVLGFGSEAIGTDAGQGYHLRPPYPCHYFMHGAGRYGLQCLCNLDLLPPTGSVLICPPLKIEQGSGSPLRVLALVAG